MNKADPRHQGAQGLAPATTGRLVGERPFWDNAGAAWRQLAGGFDEAGFSFEWHEWDARGPVAWSESFHPHSVELCLNLDGSGWVAAGASRIELSPGTAGFFVTNGQSLDGQRLPGEKHRFACVEKFWAGPNRRRSRRSSYPPLS